MAQSPSCQQGDREGQTGKPNSRIGTGLKAENKVQGQVWYDGGFGPEMDVLTVLSSLVRELHGKKGWLKRTF